MRAWGPKRNFGRLIIHQKEEGGDTFVGYRAAVVEGLFDGAATNWTKKITISCARKQISQTRN